MNKDYIYISCLNYDLSSRIFLPYIYGVLRSYAEQYEDIRNAYKWAKPLYRLNKHPEILLEEITVPSVFGISCYVWNMEKQLWIARLVKNKYPNCLVIAGGPNIPDDASEFLLNNSHVDIAVHREGEIAFTEILRERKKNVQNWGTIYGISFRNLQGKIVNTGPCKKMNLEEAGPGPYISGLLDEFVKEIHDENRAIDAGWETNRACPFSCTFCSWEKAEFGKIRKFTDGRIFAEIEWFSKNKIETVYCFDANFGILSRDTGIAEKFSELKRVTNFPKALKLDYSKSNKETVSNIGKILSDNNLNSGVTLALQSLNPHTLAAIKRINIKGDALNTFVKKLLNEKIPIYAELIIGLPLETKETFIDGIFKLMDIGIHEMLRINPLILLPNTPMIEKDYVQKYKISSIQRPFWNYFPYEEHYPEAADLVIETSTMSQNDWVDMMAISDILQALHMGGWTRLISIFMNREQTFNYKNFYAQLLLFFDGTKSKLVAKILTDLKEMYQSILENKNAHYAGWSEFSLEYNGFREKLHSLGFLSAWMKIAVDYKLFYSELAEYLGTTVHNSELITNLLHFQQKIMITPDYDSRIGKEIRSDYNFYNYFFNSIPLRSEPEHVIIQQSFDKFIAPVNGSNVTIKDYMLASTGGLIPKPGYFLHKPFAVSTR